MKHRKRIAAMLIAAGTLGVVVLFWPAVATLLGLLAYLAFDIEPIYLALAWFVSVVGWYALLVGKGDA